MTAIPLRWLPLLGLLMLSACGGGGREKNEAAASPRNAMEPAPAVPGVAPSGTPTLNSASLLPDPGPMNQTWPGRLAADPAGGRAPGAPPGPTGEPPKARLSPDPAGGAIRPDPDQRQ